MHGIKCADYVHLATLMVCLFLWKGYAKALDADQMIAPLATGQTARSVFELISSSQPLPAAE